MSRRSRAGRYILAAILAFSGALVAPAAAGAATTGQGASCGSSVLVLSAMPVELSPLVQAATLDPHATVRRDGRTFYAGRLGAVPVVMAMTGIGVANAEQTATQAYQQFRCRFAATVLSGVAGSKYSIGDVTVAQRWTLDGGQTWTGADPRMVAVAQTLTSRQLGLARNVPAGDPACACAGPAATTPLPIRLPQPPQLLVGGSGETSDPFGGYAVPCVPDGGDITGCEPCVLMGAPADDAAAFADRSAKLVDPRFLQALLTPPAPTTTTMVAQDEETAAVAAVSHRYGVPFLGIRAVSDGQGDPLGLPGFPAQFVVYRQLAADNAARVTIAFLAAWDHMGRPTGG